MLKDLVISLSLANLWFVDVWKLFLIRHSTSYPYYHWKLNPAPLLLATILDVLLFAAIMFGTITLTRRLRKESILNICRSAFAVVFLLLLGNLLLIIGRSPPLALLLYELKRKPQLLLEWRGITTIHLWLAALGLLAGSMGMTMMLHSLIYRRQRLINLCMTILLIISPFVLITFGQAAAQWVRYRSGEQFRESTAPAFARPNPGRRVLWIIFDEMDFRLSFVERPLTLELPEFDRLRKESIFASNAYPPAEDTVLSLPALINGRLVSRINRLGPNELMITFGDNGEKRPWSTEPNVFSRARAMNLNTGLAGWYHPYCRVIGTSLTRCSWEAGGVLFLAHSKIADLISYSSEVSVAESMFRVARSVFLSEMMSVLFPRENPSVWRHYFVREFSNIHERALALASDPDLNLILLHYQVPHPPGFYDRHKYNFSLSSNSGYLDNLALVDEVLKQLRQRMVEAGIWDSTTLLISSDHRLRADRWRNHPLWKPSFTKEDPLVQNSVTDRRVPFILKLAGESEPLVYEKAFNTVLSQDLIVAILSGNLSKKEEVVGWLDRHSSIAQSPYIDDER